MHRARRVLIDAWKRYAQRETPILGGPWWVYAVAIGSANVARQLLLPELGSAAQIVTFVAMITTVGALVALMFRLAGRSAARDVVSDVVPARDACLRA